MLQQRIKSSFTTYNISSGVLGVGMFLVGIFLLNTNWISFSVRTARIMTISGFCLIILAIILYIWAFLRNPIKNTTNFYNIISILRKMEKRLWQLAEKERHKDVDWAKYQITMNKINKLAGVTIPIVTSVDEAKNEVEKFEHEIVEKYLKKKERRSKRIIVIRTISRLLDSDGFGLREQRNKDKLYLRLCQIVEKYYDDYKDIIDKELKSLIKIHIDFAEAEANAILVKYRVLFIMKFAESLGIPNLFSPSMQSDIEGFEDDLKDINTNIRIDIGQYIKEMNNKAKINKSNSKSILT